MEMLTMVAIWICPRETILTGTLRLKVSLKHQRCNLKELNNCHQFTKTQSEQTNSELDKENAKTVSGNGNPQTLTKTSKNKQLDNKNEVLVSRTGFVHLFSLSVRSVSYSQNFCSEGRWDFAAFIGDTYPSAAAPDGTRSRTSPCVSAAKLSNICAIGSVATATMTGSAFAASARMGCRES
eukprot:2429751-Amphidinium_carterae.1